MTEASEPNCEPRWFPVLSKGRLNWTAAEFHPGGWRWMPEWIAQPIVEIWNWVACYFLGHLWLPEDPDEDERVPCAHCCRRKDP